LANSTSSEVTRIEELTSMEDQWIERVELLRNSTDEWKKNEKEVDVRVKSVSHGGRVELLFSQEMFVPVEEVLIELI